MESLLTVIDVVIVVVNSEAHFKCLHFVLPRPTIHARSSAI